MKQTNYKQFIVEFAGELKKCRFANFWSMSGCTKEEIKEIEEKYCFRLPDIYCEFLLKMGRNAGMFYQGTDIFYGCNINEFNNYLIETLSDDESKFELSENAFVFAHHQGYIYFFFYITDGDNPCVYGYKEGDLFPKKINESFSEFLLNFLEEQKESLKFI